jgi:hypothetical protein
MGDHFNNDVTYADKWDTEENLKALSKVKKKYYHRSVCYPSCPAAWAPEVLEMLEYLDKEFGLAYNTETIMAYRAESKWYWHFTTKPFANAFNSIRSNFLRFRFRDEEDRKYYRSRPMKQRFSRVVDAYLRSYTYGRNVFRVQVVAPIVNRIRKPKIHLRQLKEKYGRLELYFSAPDYLEQHVEYIFAKAKIKIALKGAYYPVESLYNGGWSYNVGNEYRVDDVEIKVNADGTKQRTDYVYRQAMKDLGIDLKGMEQRVIAYEKEQNADVEQQTDAQAAATNSQGVS